MKLTVEDLKKPPNMLLGSLAVVAVTSVLLLIMPSFGVRIVASVMFAFWLASVLLLGLAVYLQYVRKPAPEVPAQPTPSSAPVSPASTAPLTPAAKAPTPGIRLPAPRPARQANPPPLSQRPQPQPEPSLEPTGYEIPGAGESVISPGEKITLVVRAQASSAERVIRVTAVAPGESPIVERAPVSRTGEARVTLTFPRQGVFRVSAGFENGTGALIKESIVRVVEYREAIIRLYHAFRRHALRLNSDLSPHLTARELAETLAARGQGELADLTSIVDLSEKALYSGAPVLRGDYLHLVTVLKRLRAFDVLEGSA